MHFHKWTKWETRPGIKTHTRFGTEISKTQVDIQVRHCLKCGRRQTIEA